MPIRIGLTGGRHVACGATAPEDKPTRDFWDAIVAAGGEPVVLTPEDGLDARAVLAGLDGLLLMGGNDVDPANYGAAPHPALGELDPDRDAFELALFRYAWHETAMPIFGVCRGMQVMNVALGGTLWQDLPTEWAPGVEHRERDRRDEHVHAMRVDESFTLLEGTTAVNSLHHQAIKELAPGLKPVAWSPDGLIEAVVHEGHPFRFGVQWHPEILATWDPAAQRLFRAFLTAGSSAPADTSSAAEPSCPAPGLI